MMIEDLEYLDLLDWIEQPDGLNQLHIWTYMNVIVSRYVKYHLCSSNFTSLISTRKLGNILMQIVLSLNFQVISVSIICIFAKLQTLRFGWFWSYIIILSMTNHNISFSSFTFIQYSLKISHAILFDIGLSWLNGIILRI